MFQQYLLKGVFSRLVKGPLRIASSQCVRLRHKGAKCDKCINACPKDVIEIKDEILIKEDICDACGMCYEICPTGVFSLTALSDKKELTKREFFSYIGKGIIDTSREISDGILNKGREEIQLPKIVPEKRIMFFKNPGRSIKCLGNRYLPFTNLNIDDTCDGCDLCVLFCPTGSLSKTETKKSKKISFNMAYCTKCDLCITACPKAAIHYCENISIRSIRAKKEKPLIKHELSQCVRCSTRFVKNNNDLCPSCEKNKADESFFDGYGLQKGITEII